MPPTHRGLPYLCAPIPSFDHTGHRSDCAPNATVVLPTNFGPDGAQFNPPLTLSMQYDPATLPPGTRLDKLQIAYWDGNGWVKLKGTVDPATNTITAQISHFTIYAVLAEQEEPAPVPAPAPLVTPMPESAPALPLAPAPEPSPESATTTPAPAPSTPAPEVTPAPVPASAPASGTNPIVIIGIAGAVIVIGLLLLAGYFRRRAKKA